MVYVVKFLFGGALLLAIMGCSTGYLIDSALQQTKLLNQRVPVAEVLKDESVDAETKRKLNLAIAARHFAETELALKPSQNYNTYVKLDRPYVSYILQVSPIFELETYKWHFPIVGDVPYKGYFSLEKAQKAAGEFTKTEYDVYIRGVGAYSTLGWFRDPILSSMLRYADHDLVNTIIHETVHATVYIKSAADFNERLAMFLGNIGTEMFYLKKEGPDSPTVKQIRDENADDKVFSEFISKEIEALRAWYKAEKGRVTVEAKAQKFADLKARFIKEAKAKFKSNQYSRFADNELNNASLLSYGTYFTDLSDFEKVFTRYQRDFKEFLNFCKGLEKSDDPVRDLKKAAGGT